MDTVHSRDSHEQQHELIRNPNRLESNSVELTPSFTSSLEEQNEFMNPSQCKETSVEKPQGFTLLLEPQHKFKIHPPLSITVSLASVGIVAIPRTGPKRVVQTVKRVIQTVIVAVSVAFYDVILPHVNSNPDTKSQCWHHLLSTNQLFRKIAF